MTSYGLDEWFWAMFEPTWTWPNFTLVIFACKLGQIMTRYDFIWARWVILMFEPTWTLHNFTFGQLFMWIWENNDQIWLPVGSMSDSEQCFETDLKLYLISLSVNFSCELGQIMNRYDFLCPRWVILSNVRNRLETWPNFTFDQLFIWIGANNYQIGLPMG